MKRTLLAVPVLGLCLGLPLAAEQPDKDKPSVVPFELLATKHMAVRIKLNGKGPYRVVFDTGAPVTVLNNRIARDSGLVPKDRPKPQGLLGMLTPTQVRIKSLEVGQLKAADVPAVVMDHPTVDAMHQAFGEIEGIVGFPFFARYRMTLDYQAKQLTFVPNGYQPGDVMQNLMMSLMMKPKDEARVLGAAGLWGLVVHKGPDDEEAGVTVKEVHAGGPAARAGLKAGDRLLTVDGRWTDSVLDCYAAAGQVKPGTAATVVLRRDGKEQTLTVTPAQGL
jgi:membrane-associated protease RseP (regulator of RpoE activity)